MAKGENTASQGFGLSSGAKEENPVLTKIKATLLATDPSSWSEYGGQLDREKKYPKMLDKVEHLYTLEIPAGLLMLRCSLPVTGKFAAGGYLLQPAAQFPAYTIELRDRMWEPRELTEPHKFQSKGPEKKFQVLADGPAAKTLFVEIGNRVSAFQRERLQEFEGSVADLMHRLEDLIHSSKHSDWKKVVESKGTVTWYRNTFGELQLDLGRQMRRDGPAYRMVLSNKIRLSRVFDNVVAQRYFEFVDELHRNAGLATLDELLTEFKPVAS